MQAQPPVAMPELRVLPSPEAVAQAAAVEIAHALASAIAARGVAHWCTTGGSSAAPVYRNLRVAPLRDLVAWDRVHVWWGDERFVPPDHPLSNVLPLDQVLLASGGDEGQSGETGADVGEQGEGVRIPPAQIHSMPMAEAIGHGAGPGWAAARYAVALREQVAGTVRNGLPAFDVLAVGVGADGHVLSVFPGSAVWDDPALCTAVPAPTHVEPHVDRVTLHPRLLSAARRVLVVTTGAGKAAALARAWAGDDVRELPVRAARVGHAVWLLDEAAASGLPRP